MEDNSVHTSVVIELANTKEEPEGQNSYQIEIDDMNTPRDYVIDQIFCGENVTVYALFEVPEGDSRNLDKNYVKVNNQSNGNDKTFDYKETYKKVEKKINGYKQNSSPKASEEYLKFFSDTKCRNKSLYCLKHPSGTYDLMTPDQKKSDLRVLYSKNFALEETKSTKFKAISVGVNTDIVQCPKILEEVQKVLGVNVPLLKFREKTTETSNYFSTPSSDITEIETQQSFSSFPSATDSRVSNLFFVPLLMMDDDSLSKYSKDDSTQKSFEKDSKNCVSKVSLGINTDKSEFESGIQLNAKRKQNTVNVCLENTKNLSHCSSDKILNEKLKLCEKQTILKEIKTMQSKLSALIEQIESSSYELDDKNDLVESESKRNAFEKKKNFDERPILLTWNYFNEEKPMKNASTQGAYLLETDSVIDNDKLQGKELFIREINEINEPLELLKFTKIRWKSSGSSKSETSLLSCTKYNTLKNSSSLNFKNVKSEVFKNPKNLFLSEKNSKKNLQRKTLKNNAKNCEKLPESELRDDLKRNLNARTGKISSPQESLNPNEVDRHNEEEGDAKLEKAQLPFINGIEKSQTSYMDPNITVSDGLLSPKRSIRPCRNDSKSPDKTTEGEKKTCSDSEKPETPNMNVRKIITTHSNVKKDFKTAKKINNRHKVAEATTKVDIPFRRILTGCRVPNKTNGESKLHINNLIKTQGLNNNNNTNNNNKISSLIKSIDEKPAVKPERIQRPSSQKLENISPVLEVPNESKESETKSLKSQEETPSKKTSDSKTKVKSGLSLEIIEDSSSSVTSQKNNPPSAEPSTDSSVVVKLLSKKPEFIKDSCSEVNEEKENGNNIQVDKTVTSDNGGNRKSKTRVDVDNNLQNMEKSIVKSVWALTKVLLFEDGTKKLEVLEASLTPPGYTLNQSVKAPK